MVLACLLEPLLISCCAACCCLHFAAHACRHGCYVSGLYLEGAAWDTATGQLTRQAPRQLVDELPLLQVRGAGAL